MWSRENGSRIQSQEIAYFLVLRKELKAIALVSNLKEKHE